LFSVFQEKKATSKWNPAFLKRKWLSIRKRPVHRSLRGDGEVCGSYLQAVIPAGIYFYEFLSWEAGRAIARIGMSSTKKGISTGIPFKENGGAGFLTPPPPCSVSA
jgi:hypothetical protein